MSTENLKRNISTERLRMGMTQEDLAKRMNVSPSTISLYETGARVPNIEVIERLCSIFGVSIDRLTGYGEIDTGLEDMDELHRAEKGVEKLLSALGYFSDEKKKVVETPIESLHDGIQPDVLEEIKRLYGGKAFVKDEIHLLSVWNDSEWFEIPFDDYLDFVDTIRETVTRFLKENDIKEKNHPGE